ncbi:MAG: hypothetical protein ACREIV_12545, partial [Planctomycetaceae bacterium]
LSARPEIAPPAPIEEPAATSTAESAPPAVEEPHPMAGVVAQRRATAIFESAHGAAALIGDRIVHVGDELEAGVRVIEIRRDGVFVRLED